MDASLTPPRLITRGVILGLGVWVTLHAFVVCLTVLEPFPDAPWAAMLGPGYLPALLVGLSVFLGIVFAPGWAQGKAFAHLNAQAYRKEISIRAVFLGAWQGAALGFFLLIATRVARVEAETILRTLLIVMASSTLCVLLAVRFAKAYGGIVLFWAIGIPFLSYIVIEIFLNTPVSAGNWANNPGPEATRLRTSMEGLLNLSPGTTAIASLHGAWPSGSAFGWTDCLFFVGVGSVVAAALIRFSRPPAS